MMPIAHHKPLRAPSASFSSDATFAYDSFLQSMFPSSSGPRPVRMVALQRGRHCSETPCTALIHGAHGALDCSYT